MGRFERKPRVNARGGSSDSQIERYPAVRDELARLLVNLERIVSRGREAFFDEDETNYLAGSQLIVNFDDLAQSRLPDAVKKAHPEIPWADIHATRNVLAHNYVVANRNLVWKALSEELPALLTKLIGDR